MVIILTGSLGEAVHPQLTLDQIMTTPLEHHKVCIAALSDSPKVSEFNLHQERFYHIYSAVSPSLEIEHK